jgi:hypothetical protein
MKTGYDLGKKQAQAVRALMETVDEVLEANILVPIDFAEKRAKLTIKGKELVEAFPELDAPAEEFWHSDQPYAPDWIEEAEDSTSAAFDALISTHAIEQAATLAGYTHALNTLRSELTDLASWSSQYDVDKGMWK